jgi:hypothetical protein
VRSVVSRDVLMRGLARPGRRGRGLGTSSLGTVVHFSGQGRYQCDEESVRKRVDMVVHAGWEWRENLA